MRELHETKLQERLQLLDDREQKCLEREAAVENRSVPQSCLFRFEVFFVSRLTEFERIKEEFHLDLQEYVPFLFAS